MLVTAFFKCVGQKFRRSGQRSVTRHREIRSVRTDNTTLTNDSFRPRTEVRGCEKQTFRNVLGKGQPVCQLPQRPKGAP